MKKAQIILACLLLAIPLALPQLTGAVAAANPPQQARKPAKPVRRVSQVTLKSIDPLKEAFERDSGYVRLVTILSPT